MSLLPWLDMVVKWINCLFDDVDATSFTKGARGRLLARLLKFTADDETCEEGEVLGSDVMQELTYFIKEHFPSYYLDAELYRVMDEEDSEELVCLLSLILFYCTMRSHASAWVQNVLSSRLSEEMQVGVKTFIEKIPSDNSAITRTLVKEAALESGLCSNSPPVMFSYSPETSSSLKAQLSGTPLKCSFQSPTIQQQKRSILENKEVRKLKSQFDSVTYEYTDLQEELSQAQEQIRILNSAENLLDLQLHEQIEENKKLRIQLEEKVILQADLQKQLQQLQDKLDSLQKEIELFRSRIVYWKKRGVV